MYFKVYHKKSKTPLAIFNGNTVVDFCVSNKESIKNYYFSIDDEKDLMEWEVFARKHSDLFEKKAEERAQKEFVKVKNEEALDLENKRSRFPVILILLVLLFTAYLTYYFYQKSIKQENDLNTNETALPVANVQTTEDKSDKLEKRALVPSDFTFGKDGPAEKDLMEIWKRSKKDKISVSLDFEDIKEHMDTYLPALKECYINRAKAGDKGLRGTINMKIRISGDGVVRDVLFTDDKYQATLFGDCIISAIKSKSFPMFESPEQVFSYYWNL